MWPCINLSFLSVVDSPIPSNDLLMELRLPKSCLDNYVSCRHIMFDSENSFLLLVYVRCHSHYVQLSILYSCMLRYRMLYLLCDWRHVCGCEIYCLVNGDYSCWPVLSFPWFIVPSNKGSLWLRKTFGSLHSAET